MDFDLMLKSMPDLFHAALLTFQLMGLSMLFGLLMALPLALMRLSRHKALMLPAFGYISFFRGTPLLVQMFLVYYGLSQFAAIRSSFLWPILRMPYWCAIIAFTLNTTAYTAEILRGAIQAVPRGQIEAAYSVGMSRFQLYWRIIGPQGLVLALPGYANEVILLLKGTALASTITMLEITGMARKIIAETYKPLELFTLAALCYVVITIILTRLFNLVEFHFTAHRRPPSAKLSANLPQ